MEAGKRNREDSGSKSETQDVTKAERKSDEKTEVTKKDASSICGCQTPGPKYVLKTVVGYKDHCLSRVRNPAYTFGRRQTGIATCDSPGPKYLVETSKKNGFTFGYAKKDEEQCASPGPKYDTRKGPPPPVFTIKWRTNYRAGFCGPAPYNVKTPMDAPAFTIGMRGTGIVCSGTPGPQNPYDPDVIKPKAPLFSLALRQTGTAECNSPGPKYYPTPIKPTPIYSFGVKHSICAPPYIVKCDEQC